MAVAYEKVVPALKQMSIEATIDEVGRRVAFIKRLRAVIAGWVVWAAGATSLRPRRAGV